MLMLSGPVSALGAALSAVLLFVIGWRGRNQTVDPHPAAKAALLTGLAVAAGRTHSGDAVLAAAAVVLLAVALLELGYRSYLKVLVQARQLPGFAQPAAESRPGPFHLAVCLLGGLLATAVVWPVPSWLVAGIVLVVFSWRGFVAIGEVRAWSARRTVRRASAALAAYRPEYCIYFSGKPEGLYQIGMWLPFLERTGRRYVIILREAPTLPAALALTGEPVLAVRSLEVLERFMVDSIGAVFYVNNEPKNVNGVRFLGFTHVHLGHGDSDKPSSYNPTFAMFDRIFVAGQAAIDRFADHRVSVERDKFVIVGRPQVESIAVVPQPAPPVRTVLYAPTWRGGLADMTLGSLSVGERIVAALLRRGLLVWFRPHPYSARDSESRVQIARIDDALRAAGNDSRTSADTAGLTLVECFNASDAMVSDISSVASDYLYSRKPLAIVDMRVTERALDEEYPVARAAYVLDGRGDIEAVLDEFVGYDPLADLRAAVRRHYLGDFAAESYAQVFVDAAAEAMDNELGRARRTGTGG